VPLEEPSWWYRAEPSATARLLKPAGRLYAWAVERRFRHVKPYRSPLPVMCVGNLTAGGTGKTPLALLLAEELKRLGEHPAFLTRGYGGRHAGPRWVDHNRDTTADVGDEALLLSRAALTLISRDRAEGARAIEATGKAPSVIVMDDGLQNPTLAKDLTVAVVDARRGVGNGEVLPAGPLRAPLAFQLGLVDAVVVNGVTYGPASGEASAAAWLKQLFPGPVLEAAPVAAGELAWIEGARLVPYAGIADPGRFFAMLEHLGGHVVETVLFADHYSFTEKDAERLLAIALRQDAQLVTTEKDWVRLLGLAGRRGELRERSRTLRIRLAFEERDASRLTALLQTALQSRRAASAPATR
jgi:tetraacyldisaccharide 4'-kinase